MKSETLHGTWSLVSFEIENLDGIRKPWGTGTHGLLMYAPSGPMAGHMSVSINKDIENDPEQTEAENLFESILFYSGSYQVEGDLIRHRVTQASNPARIGKEMLRYATIDGETLELATPRESFGRGILTWKRV